MGYLIGGIIPLLPYFFIPRAHVALVWSAIVTGITLLVFGVVKTHVSGASGGASGYVWGAVTTLFVGVLPQLQRMESLRYSRAKSKPIMTHYLLSDILSGSGGSSDVTVMPFNDHVLFRRSRTCVYLPPTCFLKIYLKSLCCPYTTLNASCDCWPESI